LATLEKEIEDPERYSGANYQLVEDCLHAALLARSLELPKVEIEGRFVRAEQIAQKVDHPHQRLRVAYNRAWTCFWWYEDFGQFLQHYSQVESLAINNSSADDLELLTNLWQLLHSSCARGMLDSHKCELDNRTRLLVEALKELVNDKTRRNRALHAKTELCLINLALRAAKKENLSFQLRELRTIIKEAKGMISYPFEPIPKIVEELGEFLTDVLEYDELLEETVSSARERLSQQEAGRMLLARGFQKLRANKIYDAIVLFGRAQQLLAMRESRWEISEALFACGTAYEAAGLLWIARANVLASMNQTLSEFWEEGHVAPPAMISAQKLAWIELQLGRPSCVMEWMRCADAIANSVNLDESAKEKFREVRFYQDILLGALFLRAGQEDLRYLQYLPDVLEALGLEISRIALLYALGYEEQLRIEGQIPATESPEDFREFFLKWLNQPGGDDLAERLVGVAGKMTFVSCVLGCRLRVVVEDDNESIFLAERLLGAIEALLSTSINKRAFPFREEYLLRVERSRRLEGLPKLEIDIDRGFSILRHSGDVTTNTNCRDDWFFMTVAQLVSQIVTISDIDGYFKRVMGEELGLWRAINFTETSTPVSNILGMPKLRISDWNTDGEPNAYIVRRIVPWHDGLILVDRKKNLNAPTMGVGDPSNELIDRSAIKHSSRQVSSVINIPLWDKARWGGVFYILAIDDLDEPPGLGLIFKDGAAGRSIFEELRKKLGPNDEDDRLRISIITGIDNEDPAAYGVVVGTNLPGRDEEREPREIISVSRIHRMEKPNPLNLKRFEDRVVRTKLYGVFPVQAPASENDMKMFGDLAIMKKTIRITPAWQIGNNDIDSMAIRYGDSPIIPPEVIDAPVLKLLDRLKQ